MKYYFCFALFVCGIFVLVDKLDKVYPLRCSCEKVDCTKKHDSFRFCRGCGIGLSRYNTKSVLYCGEVFFFCPVCYKNMVVFNNQPVLEIK